MPTKKDEVYICGECENQVKIVEPGKGLLMCCDAPMKVEKGKKETAADKMQSWGGDFKGRTLQ